MKFEIPLHSFIDLITNSSTEIYVAATDKTVRMFREIIDQVLKVAGSKKSCDDLLKLSVARRCNCEKDGYECDGPEDCRSARSVLVVETVGEKTPELDDLLNRLNNLTGLFEYGEVSN